MAARDPENKRKVSKWWPREAYYGRQGPRKQAESIKMVAPRGLLRMSGTPKTAKMHQSSGTVSFFPADRTALRLFLKKAEVSFIIPKDK